MKIIDLSHLLNNETPVFPGTPKPDFSSCNNIAAHGFAELLMRLTTHTGTHIDAPCHILEEGKALSDFPIHKFTGKAMCLDVRNRKTIDLHYLKKKIKNPANLDFILFQTGWDQFWGENAYFENYPVLEKEATLWLSGFHLKGLGFDAISIDAVHDELLFNHHIILQKEILIIENLCNLDALPDGEFEFFCLPLFVEGADGSPVRAIAKLI